MSLNSEIFISDLDSPIQWQRTFIEDNVQTSCSSFDVNIIQVLILFSSNSYSIQETISQITFSRGRMAGHIWQNCISQNILSIYRWHFSFEPHKYTRIQAIFPFRQDSFVILNWIRTGSISIRYQRKFKSGFTFWHLSVLLPKDFTDGKNTNAMTWATHQFNRLFIWWKHNFFHLNTKNAHIISINQCWIKMNVWILCGKKFSWSKDQQGTKTGAEPMTSFH